MRTQAFSDHHLFVRATTGQALDIRYDPATNAIEFIEDDWASDVRAGVTPRGVYREQLDTPKVRRLPRRYAA